MPIYAYRCAECGQAKDVLQKLSDPVLSTCPFCGSQAFAKQVTAAGFQLKGSGWYATDFKGGGKAAAKTEATADSAASKPAGGEAAASKPAAGGAAAAKPAAGASAAASTPAAGCGGSCACH